MQAAQKRRVGVLLLVTVLSLAACAAAPGADRTFRPTAWPLASPVAQAPVAGICADFAGPSVSIAIEPDMADPRCARVTDDQHLIVENRTEQALEIAIALFTATVPAGQIHSFDSPFGEYLEPGVHRLAVSGLPLGAEVWLVSDAPEPNASSQAPIGAQPSTSAPAPSATETPVSAAPSPLPVAAPPTEEAPSPWAAAQAFYGAGLESGPVLYAWSRARGERALDLIVFPGAVVSRSGRWVATPATYPGTTAVRVYDLELGTQAEYPASPDYVVHRLAFDPAETRLAFLELAPLGVEATPWAMVVVRLDDGTLTRFEGNRLPEADRYPGNPLGWTAAGDELITDQFIPHSDGACVGVRALSMAPGAPDGFASGQVPRVILAAGEYMSTVRLSPLAGTARATRLLYLGREPGYAPADYEAVLGDWAVNELWTLDLATGERTMWYQATNGDALFPNAAWSPDGWQVLFAQGRYAGPRWATLTLKIADAPGRVHDVDSVPIEDNASLSGLYWCAPEAALVEFKGPALLPRLRVVDLTSDAGWWQPEGGESAFVLGCIAPEAR